MCTCVVYVVCVICVCGMYMCVVHVCICVWYTCVLYVYVCVYMCVCVWYGVVWCGLCVCACVCMHGCSFGHDGVCEIKQEANAQY